MALGFLPFLGSFATAPNPMQEITYLFVTIGMAVINALSDEFLDFVSLTVINSIVLLFILIGEFYLLKLAYTDHKHPLEEDINRRIVLQLPLKESELHTSIEKEVQRQQENLKLTATSHKVAKIDFQLGTVTVHLFY